MPSYKTFIDKEPITVSVSHKGDQVTLIATDVPTDRVDIDAVAARLIHLGSAPDLSLDLTGGTKTGPIFTAPDSEMAEFAARVIGQKLQSKLRQRETGRDLR